MKKQSNILRKMLLLFGALVLVLVVVIVLNKEKPTTVAEESPPFHTLAPETLGETDPPQETIDEQPVIETDPVEQPIIAPTNEQPTVPPATTPKPNGTSDGTPTLPAEDKPKLAIPTPQEQPQQAETKPIKDGTYQVGKDLVAGEYIVFSNGMTFLENTSDLTGNPESIVFNIALDGHSHAYVTLQSGEYLKIDSGEMYPVETAPSLKPANGMYKSGQYKVGTDIPAGKHQIRVDDTNDIGFYEISKSSRQEMTDFITSDVVEGATWINVTNGQYVTIRNAIIEVK